MGQSPIPEGAGVIMASEGENFVGGMFKQGVWKETDEVRCVMSNDSQPCGA